MASKSSHGAPAKKRRRLSTKSSSRPSGSSGKKSSLTAWDPTKIKQTASQVYPGLDIDGNPMYGLFKNLSMSYAIMKLPPIRDLDWRNNIMKPIYHSKHYNAALGQRAGIVASPGQVCERCLRGCGSFNSCVVLCLPGDQFPLFKGSCTNCAFSGSSVRCNNRTLIDTPKRWTEWVRTNSLNGLVPHPSNGVGVESHLSVPVETGLPHSPSNLPKQHGPTYSTKWYKSPLDDKLLAKSPSGILYVREDLRRIRARVAYDIKKLSKFAGDGGSDKESEEESEEEIDECVEDDEPNPFYDSDTGDDGVESKIVASKVKSDADSDDSGDEVDSVDVDSLNISSADLDSDDSVGSNDVDSEIE